MTRKKKILLTLLVSLFLILISLSYILRHTGNITPKAARDYRIKKLQFFRKKVESFVQENKRLPESLFEAMHKDLQEKGWWCFSPIVIASYPFPEEIERDPLVGINDPNFFERIVEYGFFSGSRGWFVRELKPGAFYTKMLMVD